MQAALAVRRIDTLYHNKNFVIMIQVKQVAS